MKLYYIEDTMFVNSKYAAELRERFFQRIHGQQECLVLISSTHTRDEQLALWKQGIDEHILVLESPVVFDHQEIKGNLHATFLALEGYPVVEAFNGTLVEIDTETHTMERIYFDLFPDHLHQNELDLLMDQLEDMLSEKMKGYKKKKDRVS